MSPTRPARRDEELTTELLRESTDSITALIEERLPLMLDGDLWGAVAHGFLARVGTLQEALTVMVEKGMPGEAQMLLRILFEHVTIFCWLAIDPEPHVERWQQWAGAHQLKVHNEAKRFGVKVLSDADVAALRAQKKPYQRFSSQKRLIGIGPKSRRHSGH